MLVPVEKIESVFRKVRQVQDDKHLYCIAGERLPVSVEDITSVVSSLYGVEIEKEEVWFEGEHVRGLYERYANNRVRILVRADQPDFWKRFTTVKELAHVIIDEPEDWTTDGRNTIESMIREQSVPDQKVPDAHVVSENLAVLAAMELLIPHPLRRGDGQLIVDNKQTLVSLSIAYEVPEVWVARAIGDDYRKIADPIWERILKTAVA